MKKVAILSLFILLIQVVNAQVINLGAGRCTHCSMFIQDQRFAAIAVDSDGSVYRFDAVECLINFLKTKGERQYKSILVNDFSKPGHWVEAKGATYLRCENIPSPMGAYLSAFGHRAEAEKIAKNQNGEIYNWEEIKVKFSNSRFGSINHSEHHHHASALAPIGVMGAHLHHRGGWMISFRTMRMNMEGSLKGSDAISADEVWQNYAMAPGQMQMTMHMLGTMYAPIDKLTVMLMQPYIVNGMSILMKSGMSSNTKSYGIGDTWLSALYSLWANERHSFHINAGISLANGSIDERDDLSMYEDMRLAYTMQLGSGTYDYMIGATFRYSTGSYNLGCQSQNTVRTGHTGFGYRTGNIYLVNTRLNYKASRWLALSARLQTQIRREISGNDVKLNPMMSPMTNSANSGGRFLNGGIGVALNIPDMDKLILGAEWITPLFQNVNGIQMKPTNQIIMGVQYSI